MAPHRFPPPWRAQEMPGGYVGRDANDQALAYIYSRSNEVEALQAKLLTEDEARRGEHRKVAGATRMVMSFCAIRKAGVVAKSARAVTSRASLN